MQWEASSFENDGPIKKQQFLTLYCFGFFVFPDTLCARS